MPPSPNNATGRGLEWGGGEGEVVGVAGERTNYIAPSDRLLGKARIQRKRKLWSLVGFVSRLVHFGPTT